MMPVMNDLNPLFKIISNPGLKRSTNHNFSGSYRFKLPRSGNLSIDANARISLDAIGNRTTYDSKTGAYTTMQDNVDETNWNLGGGLSLVQPLDSARRFTIDASLREDYSHSVDFDIAYDGAAMALSRVNNFFTTGKLGFNYSKGKFTVGISGNAVWRRSTGDRENFQTINAWDFDYGFNLTAPLPWKFTLATDLRMYSSRGYVDRYMNTDDPLWNATLSRSFLKGKLTASLQAFDILHQLTSTIRTCRASAGACCFCC